jgi:hypothetical protein
MSSWRSAWLSTGTTLLFFIMLIAISLSGPNHTVYRHHVLSVSLFKFKCDFSIFLPVTLIGGVVFLLFAITALFFDPNAE